LRRLVLGKECGRDKELQYASVVVAARATSKTTIAPTRIIFLVAPSFVDEKKLMKMSTEPG
jgi:hypothetical protein